MTHAGRGPGTQNLPFELQPGETVLNVARRHPVFLWLRLAGAALAGLVPFAVILVVVGATTGFGSTGGRILVAAAVLWLAYWLVRLYFVWYRYNNDLWIITNQRIVDSAKNHWFHHRMASADLINVEDLAIDRHGIFATVFNYGNVVCQTSGTRSNFVLSGIPNPAALLALVDASRDAARREFGAAGRIVTGQ